MSSILFVVNDASYFLAHWLNRARAAAATGFEVHVAVPADLAISKIEAEGFVVHEVPLDRKGTNVLREIRTLWALLRLYRTLRPSLIHHITIKPIIYGGIAARLVNSRATVHAVTGLGSAFLPKAGVAAIGRKLLLLAYRFAAWSRCVRVTVENPDDGDLLALAGIVPQTNIRVILGAGVDMREFRPTPESPGVPVVIFASRMLWEKGVEDFVEAAARLKAEGVAARFVLVGDTDKGSSSAVPTSRLQEWHDSNIIEWWGRRGDMPDVFRQAHIVCLPSFYREGIPRVLIEAAACGRPAVTTDMPGCREAVRHGVNGLVVPPRDIDALCSALKALISDPVLRREMGARGRALALDRFSDDKVIAQTLAIYRELLINEVVGQPPANAL